MTGGVERFSADALLPPGRPAHVMTPRLGAVATHWHDYYELCLVLEGTGRHVLNGDEHRVRPGSAFLLSPVDFHALEPDDGRPGAGLHCLNVVVEPRVVERELVALGTAASALPWRAEEQQPLEPELRRLRRELDGGGAGSARVAAALLTCLVTELARAAAVASGPSPSAPSRPTRGGPLDDLDAAVLHVDRHFREPLTLAGVAAVAHLSPNYFSERFRDHVGASFQHYLQERRLAFARSLLASTPLSVGEVCHAAGFGNLSHFGRAFRRRYGVPPSDPHLRAEGPGPGRTEVPLGSRSHRDVIGITRIR